MKIIIRTAALALLLLAPVGFADGFLGSGLLGDGFLSEDMYVTIENETLEGVASTIGYGALGDTLYATQEGVHDSLTGLTGVTVDYWYLWLCMGSECAPFDPFTVGN